MKKIFAFIGLICIVNLLFAQNSYIYIEGIKGIPFKVISDNKEVPKLGKSYSIISFSEPGEKNIDITFLNSNFDKQRFIVDVQPNSSYGFRMGKTDENKFYLIDIVNEGKIIETNTPVNLALSTEKNIINSFQAVGKIDEIVSKENNIEEVPPLDKKGLKRERKRKLAEEAALKEKTVAKTKEKDIEKYGVVEVISSNEANNIAEKITEKPVTKPIKPTNNKNIRNPNCPKTASEAEIKSILDKIQTKSDDDAKLLLIKKKVLSGCFEAKQVISIAQTFNTQFGRLALAKFVIPLTIDPANLIQMESLFKSDTYKSKLQKLLE